MVTKAQKLEFMSIWYQALEQPLGLVLRTSDPARARQALYAARAEAQDEALGQLQIRMWQGENGENLVIVHLGKIDGAELARRAELPMIQLEDRSGE